jgi:subtilisin family serine protease
LVGLDDKSKIAFRDVYLQLPHFQHHTFHRCHSDPYYSDDEWVFKMINLFPVWDLGYFGRGIRVQSNDSGVDSDHPEFSGRFDWSALCDSAVKPSDPTNTHGTAVASIIAGANNDDVRATGVAPQAQVSACNAFTGTEDFLG